MRLRALSGSRLSAFAFEEAGLRGSGWASWASRDCRGRPAILRFGAAALAFEFAPPQFARPHSRLCAGCVGLGQAPCVFVDFWQPLTSLSRGMGFGARFNELLGVVLERPGNRIRAEGLRRLFALFAPTIFMPKNTGQGGARRRRAACKGAGIFFFSFGQA